MCADSTVKENVEKLMDGNKADMVFTDPPYGINLDTDGDNDAEGEIDGLIELDGERLALGLIDGEIELDGDKEADGETLADGLIDGETDELGLIDGETELEGDKDADGDIEALDDKLALGIIDGLTLLKEKY